MFESMFHMKSGLLEGANPEDVALVAPALGMGGEGVEGSDVMATLPLGAVEAAGGLFQSQLKERGVIVDEAAGTAIVPSVATTGAWLGDNNAATLGPLPMTMGVKGSTAMMPPHVVVSPTSSSGTTYAGTANMISSTSEYQYDTQDILQEYGASTQWSNWKCYSSSIFWNIDAFAIQLGFEPTGLLLFLFFSFSWSGIFSW
jgi:hypothetical protein